MLPGLVDSQGPLRRPSARRWCWAHVGAAGNIAAGDFTGNKATDLAIADKGGITLIYGKPPTVAVKQHSGDGS